MTSFPPAGITWSKEHGELTQSRAAIRDGQLSIVHAQKEDFGLYKFKASNILGHDSALTHLSVLELPRFTTKPPGKLDVRTKQNISVPCHATGDPKPKVRWMRENNELPARRSQVSVNGTLQIWNIEDKDSGIYTCTANSGGLFKTSSLMQMTVRKGKERFDWIFYSLGSNLNVESFMGQVTVTDISGNLNRYHNQN